MQMLTNANDVAIQQVVNMIKQGNPQQVVVNLLQEKVRTGGGPIFSNIMNLVQKGDYQQLENIARNMVKEKGLDFDSEFNSFKQKFGL